MWYSFDQLRARAAAWSCRRLPGHVEDLPRGRRCFSGLRWQSRHHSISSEFVLPGQRHLVDAAVAGCAADALVDVDAVVEVDEVGQVVDALPGDRLAGRDSSRAPARASGCRPRSAEWQFMQVFVGGMPANAEVSTEVWQ